MSVVVRKATKEDMPEVHELIKELAVFEKQPNAVQINVDTLVAEGFSSQPLFTCFVNKLFCIHLFGTILLKKKLKAVK